MQHASRCRWPARARIRGGTRPAASCSFGWHAGTHSSEFMSVSSVVFHVSDMTARLKKSLTCAYLEG